MKKKLLYGILFIGLFIIWTILIQVIDVQAIGPNHTNVGFATMNKWFHNLTGVHLNLYIITDWLSILPFIVCICFGCLGLFQLIKRKSLFKVDTDLIILGIYYVLVIFIYLLFERIPINYRPILINGILEVSYPSSTTLLVLSVMPTLIVQAKLRFKYFNLINIVTKLFIIFMVMGRLISGVHWFTDIVGSILLTIGLLNIYESLINYK